MFLEKKEGKWVVIIPYKPGSPVLARLLNKMNMYHLPYGSKYNSADAAAFLSILNQNPNIKIVTSFVDRKEHSEWMKAHAVKKPYVKRQPAKAVHGKVQFIVGKEYWDQESYYDEMSMKMCTYNRHIVVKKRTPTQIVVDLYDIGGRKFPDRRYKIKIDSRTGNEKIFTKYDGFYEADDPKKKVF